MVATVGGDIFSLQVKTLTSFSILLIATSVGGDLSYIDLEK